MSDPNKIQPPKKGIEMVKGGGYPAKAVSTSVQQHTAPIQTDMYLIGAEAVKWALIGLAFYAAFRLFRSAIMDALGFRKSRREFKEANALNENGLENLDQDPMSEEEQETYIPSSEPLAEYEGFDGEEPPDNMPDSPEDDPGLQYDLENERWEINASAALQEGHEYGSDEFYSRISELEEMDRLAEQYEPSESDDEPPESDMSLDDEALEIAVAESVDWEKEANSGALDERVERIKQELQQENQ
ncbi:hypothetical protein A7P85_02075 [Eikenella corrodens]|uniref:Uncharacterized protein n=1 Tax=Eikenella corrodens TaxID=539 RepID=A0A1A9RIG0_EIKCO|nr:hypothetical protein [Eikenella corrodens]OAM18487.1 hypothetical protein A7P85_02075 [Eikenella corrodens]